jgi:hypothetical protein
MTKFKAEDFEDGAEYEVVFSLTKEGVALKTRDKTLGLDCEFAARLASSIRLIKPAPVKARPLEVAEVVKFTDIFGYWEDGITVKAIVGHQVWVSRRRDFDKIVNITQLSRPSGVPIEGAE